MLCFRSVNSDEANLFRGATKANCNGVAICDVCDDAMNSAVRCDRYLFLGAAEYKQREKKSRDGYMNARHARSFI